MFEEIAHHLRIGVTNRVGQADAIRTGIEQCLHQSQHLGRFHAALQRAAKSGADAAFDERLRRGRVARGTDARDFLHYLIGSLAQIRQAVRMTGGKRHQQ